MWVSPLINWTDDDMAEYRRRNPDMPRNEVSDHLHMSGECLCGAYAKPDEIEAIRMFYPTVAAEIDQLEAEVVDAGNAPPERCVWGWGGKRAPTPEERGQLTLLDETLCASCERWWEVD